MDIRAVDLFCGAGGLTYGLTKSGIRVVVGVDSDPACKYPFEANNLARFVLKGVEELSATDVAKFYGKAEFKVLAGCAPCQAFSSYTQSDDKGKRSRWALLERFADLFEIIKPDIVTMENVWQLTAQPVFQQFLNRLKAAGYESSYARVDCRDYGVPQSRVRLVLIASRHGSIDIPPSTHAGPKKWRTVKQTIRKLPKLSAGDTDEHDPLHTCSELSDINLKRMRASRAGGTWRDWPLELRAKCHTKKSGMTYPGVYGRMRWKEPSPTITGQAFGFGNGRFGHPVQNRAISLREAARLQTFPAKYKFVRTGEDLSMKHVGRMIGNAVPPRLGKIIGRAIVAHIKEVRHSRKLNDKKGRRSSVRS